jgi:formyl-CoA transferase
MSERPLDGVRVVEFGNFIAGPFAGQILADMGADVIKVEPPTGDPWRHERPFMPGESRVFLGLNRGKRSICLDLKEQSAVEVCHRLIATADAVVSNNRPDTAARLGIDYATLSAINPRLVFCEITAYGPEGPKAGQPGFDLIVQGYSGVIASEGKQWNGHPDPVRSASFIDFSTAYGAVNGILGGLVRRTRTGVGGLVQTSLLANALAMQTMPLTSVDGHPSPAQRWHSGERQRLEEGGASFSDLQQDYVKTAVASVYRAYYRAYRTLDGAIALGALAHPTRIRLLRLLVLDDPRLTEPGYDAESQEAMQRASQLVSDLESRFALHTTSEWEQRLRSHDIPCEPVRWVEEMVDDEQSKANGYIASLSHPAGFTYRTSGPLLRFDGQQTTPQSSPGLGAHTREVLADLGYEPSEVDQLVSSGAAGSAD